MNNIERLQKRQSDISTQLDAMLNTALKEERDFTDAEKETEKTLLAEFETNKAMLKRKEESRTRATAVIKEINRKGEEGEKKQIQKRYSITKAIASQLPNQRRLEGLELEMHEEAEKESRGFGKNVSGVGVPSMLFKPMEKRDLTVGTNTQIGYTVATDVGQMIPYLQPRLMAVELGATMLTGLTSNVDFPRNDAIATATWEGETDANAETNPTVDRIQLTPNRLGAFIDYSKQLLLQSTISVDAFVTRQLSRSIAIALDTAALNGSGASNQPTGILNTTGIGNVPIGTNGGAPTRNHIVDLINELAVDNADMGALSFLTTPGVRAKLQKTATDAGSGLFVWGERANALMGYRAEVSTQVPSNLTKGSGTDLHAIIFGNWNELMIAQWGGLDLLVDPYTQGTNSLIRVVANSWWDVALAHAASFAAVKDADVS
jgi:HK97 family phage major capsid protein